MVQGLALAEAAVAAVRLKPQGMVALAELLLVAAAVVALVTASTMALAAQVATASAV
jgi:hypothetical protein